MKLVMIGPEGAGKTVFLAMLSRYIEAHAQDLVLKPSDFASSDYIAAALAALDRGDWPKSNPMGELRLLKWQFGKGKTLHDLEMLDSAGQDLRKILKSADEGNVDNDSRALIQHLDSADVLIFLLDLGGFVGTRDFRVQNENAWLLNAFLSNQVWSRMKRIVVASKADLFMPMLDEVDGNVKIALQKVLADIPNVKQAIAANDEVPYLAISSIKTTTKVGVDGKPRRIPVNPIQCGDFEPVVEQLRGTFERKWLMEFLRRLARFFGYVVLPGLILAMIANQYIFSRQTFRITFFTPSLQKAGTDAQVYTTLIGTEGTSGQLNFDGRAPSETSQDSFELAGVDVFTRTTSRVGTVRSIEVGHDDSGRGGGWFLGRIEIEEVRKGSVAQRVSFPCGKWLDQSSGHGLRVKLEADK